MLHSNLSVNSAGHLVTGQSDVVELAMKYGTPLYILDEDRVRENCRKYKDAMSKYAAPGSAPLYAGKALCYAGIYKTMMQEGFSADVVSAGELYTAMRVGFPTVIVPVDARPDYYRNLDIAATQGDYLPFVMQIAELAQKSFAPYWALLGE